jgi:hypothetical protein
MSQHSFFSAAPSSSSVTASGAKRKAEESAKGSAKKVGGAKPAFAKKR